MMISFSQNAEDVVLARAFRHQGIGRYVDVGAAHPVDHSVTKHFHDLGWRGVNVEPHPGFLALLEQHRPRDVNLGVALASHVGEATFFLGPEHHPGGSTLSHDVATSVWGGAPEAMTAVRLTTLNEILAEHVGDETIDFLKIDVEGTEREVIRGCDWRRWRPRVVVVEATAPNSPTPNHEDWQPLLIDAGYDLALFDGLNRFYARSEDRELRELLSIPANVFDDWVPIRQVELERRLDEAEDELVRWRARSGAIEKAEAERQLAGGFRGWLAHSSSRLPRRRG